MYVVSRVTFVSWTDIPVIPLDLLCFDEVEMWKSVKGQQTIVLWEWNHLVTRPYQKLIRSIMTRYHTLQ